MPRKLSTPDFRFAVWVVRRFAQNRAVYMSLVEAMVRAMDEKRAWWVGRESWCFSYLM